MQLVEEITVVMMFTTHLMLIPCNLAQLVTQVNPKKGGLQKFLTLVTLGGVDSTPPTAFIAINQINAQER